MVKILLKRVGKKDIKSCQKEVEKISRIAISAKSMSIPNLRIVSRKEFEVEEKMNNANRLKEG